MMAAAPPTGGAAKAIFLQGKCTLAAGTAQSAAKR